MNKKQKIVPGTLVQHKKTGELAFVEHTYAQAFGGRSKALSLLWLDDNGEIECSSAWSYPSQFNILESDVEANLKKIATFLVLFVPFINLLSSQFLIYILIKKNPI